MANLSNIITPTNVLTATSTNTVTNKTINASNNTLIGIAPLDSPALTNVPTAPTAAVGTNTTQLATTAFVLANASGGVAFSAF